MEDKSLRERPMLVLASGIYIFFTSVFLLIALPPMFLYAIVKNKICGDV